MLAAAPAAVHRAGTRLRAPFFACRWLESATTRDPTPPTASPASTSLPSLTTDADGLRYRRAGPFIQLEVLSAYALDMGAEARDLAGPPHHIQRLSTMAAMAIAIVLAGLLAALPTHAWRIPAWCAGTAAIVFGLASIAFPDQRGAAGRGLGGGAVA